MRRLQYWMVWKLKFYCQTMFNNCVVKAQTFQTFTLLYTAGIYPTLVLNKNAKAKREEVGSLLKLERQKRQIMYTQDAAAHGSVRSLLKGSNLPVSKVRQFLHLKPSYTKFTLTKGKFKRMKASTDSKKKFGVMTSIRWWISQNY